MSEKGATKRVAKNFSWLLVGNTLSGLITLSLVIYIARVLGAKAFGLYQFAQAFVVYLVILVDYGISLLGTREIARERAQAGGIALNLLFVRTITAVALFVVACAVVFVLPISRELQLLFSATFLFIFYRALNTEWVFSGLELMEYIPPAKIMFSAGTLLLVFWLVKGPPDLIRVPVVFAISGVVTSLLVIIFLYTRLLPFQLKQIAPRTWPAIIWQALPLGASIFLGQIYNNLDMIMLGFMARPAVVGYYSVAYRILFVCLGFFVIWQQTALPIMSHRMANDRQAARVFIKKFVRLTAMVFVPICLLVYLTAPLIVGLAFGPQYSAAVVAVQLLIWTLLMIKLSSCHGVLILIPAGRYHDFMLSTGAGALVNITFNFLLIPQFGMIGAAISTILAETTGCLMMMYFTQRVMKINLFKEYLLPGLIVSFSVVVYWLTALLSAKLPGYLQLAVGGAAFMFSYAVLLLLIERVFIFSFVKELIKRK